MMDVFDVQLAICREQGSGPSSYRCESGLVARDGVGGFNAIWSMSVEGNIF